MKKERLCEIADIVSGISAPKSFINKNEKNAIPFIRAGMLEKLCAGKDEITEYLDATKFKKIPKETVIFAKSGMSSMKNRIYTTKKDSIIVGHLVGIICKEMVYSKYIEYYFKYNKPSKLIKNDSYPSIRIEDIKNIEIVLPEKEEQIKIVKTLSLLEDIIRIKTNQIDAIDNLVKSQFEKFFGNIKEYKRLEQFSTLITKGASPRWQGLDYKSEGTLFVTSENVKEGYIDLSKSKYLDNKINKILPRSILKKDDILVNIVGASIGRAGKYDYDYLANINQAVALVRTKNINNVFLLHYLNSEQAIKMYNDMKKGGARDNLSLKNISDLKIPNASMELQNKFAEFVKQINEQKKTCIEIIDKLNELKKCKTQEYFGGVVNE